MALKRHINPEETSAARIRRYITGGVMLCLFFLFSLWAGWGWLVVLPFVADHYFTKYINWGWGRNHPNKIIRAVIISVGDVLYVVTVVTFIFTFFFQNFAIPSSSLEKTLLTGDYLFVTKHKYGPRLPMTVGLPLVHNQIFGHESYLNKPICSYRRLSGTGKVERDDIVVFNFPAGDTVALGMTNPDYLTLCYLYGRDEVHSNKREFGEIVYRPVDRRDHYVKRCVGLPGETLQIIETQVYIDGKPITNPREMQLNHFVQTDGREISRELLDALEINYRDVAPLNIAQVNMVDINAIEQRYRLKPIDTLGNFGRVYEIPLTEKNVTALRNEPGVRYVGLVPHYAEESLTYPLAQQKPWTIDNYGPVLIPKRGMTIVLTEENYLLYERCIRAYEGHQLERYADGTILINGHPATDYTFAMDYYFMLGDNRHNSADSRAWGFVPEDHIVGQPALVWLSLNDEQGLFSGMIRLGRMFRLVSSH